MANLLSGLCFLAAVQAAQPSARSPVSAPLRDLPWAQLNFLHTTDTHGWHAGHLREPFYSADWGDYISFAQRLREKAEGEGKDLLLIDTGDRIEGNGLYDASDPKGNYTREIFTKQHIDIICSGNHELYKKNSSDDDYTQLVPSFKGNYLASNLDILDPQSGKRVLFAPRFKKFKTKVQGIRIVAFGFMFDFTGNDKNTFVIPVEETIKEDWFQEAVRDQEVDLFLVAGHVGIRMEEFDRLYKAIRDVQWDAPIMFFGGHTHVRDFAKYDDKSYALESGRYMETIGFQSISGLNAGGKKRKQDAAALPSYGRRYIDNNLFSFHHHTGLNDSTFPTELGKNISSMISSARKSLELDSKLGCAPQDLWANRAPYPDNSSIFTWLDSQVVPSAVVDPDRSAKPRIIIANTGAMRFDIFKGPFTKDTSYIVSPFTSQFRYINDVPYDLADRLLTVLNKAGPILEDICPDLKGIMLPPPEQISKTEDTVVPVAPLFAADLNQAPLQDDSKLSPGYTTKDDAGDDGDDTIHSPISFYRVPNCFESRVNTTQRGEDGKETPVDKVDLVFIEFIQQWIIVALKFLGGEYEESDTKEYIPGKDFTTLISEWIKENWDGDC